MLVKKPPSNEKREENNKNNKISVVLSVLLLIYTYLYLFSSLWKIHGLPSPNYILKDIIGFQGIGVYDNDGNLDSNVFMYLSDNLNFIPDTERLIFFSLIACSFLFSYFLPVKHKKKSLIFFASIIIFLIFNLKILCFFLLLHFLVFSFLHIESAKKSYTSIIIGFLLPFIFSNNIIYQDILSLIPFSIIISYLFFNNCIYPILNLKNSKIPSFLRLIILQSPMITCLLLPFFNYFSDNIIKLSVGILLFFWQWERIMMYQIDYNDGAIPDNINIIDYLSIFINPSIIPNWNWGASVAQGYTYCENNFLSKDKNVLAIEGIKIFCVSLIYLTLGMHISKTLSHFFHDYLGINNYTNVALMVREFSEGKEMSTLTVLLSTFLSQVRWFMLFGGIVHLRVGLWRIHGYDVKSYFDKPWLATNLANFWVRYTFHYREFLFRVFYYPFFSKFFKKNMTLRVFAATLFSLTVGNFFWGHLTEEMFYKGFKLDNFKLIYTLPYYILLGLGISLTQIYLLKKKNKRKPWTKDKKFILDILCSYLTFQSYSLIHIFARPVENGNFLCI